MKSRSARGLGFASAGLMALALGCYEESSPLDLNAKATGPSEEFLKSKRDQPAPAQRPGGGGGGKGGKGGGKAGGKSAPLAATDTKSNRAIMQKVGKEPEALASKLGAALKAESPDWTPVQSSAKELALLAAALGKNDPTKGAQDSWTKLTGEFASLAATMEKNAAAKDKVGATTAHAALMKACAACHAVHRPAGSAVPGGKEPGGPAKSAYPGSEGRKMAPQSRGS